MRRLMRLVFVPTARPTSKSCRLWRTTMMRTRWSDPDSGPTTQTSGNPAANFMATAWWANWKSCHPNYWLPLIIQSWMTTISFGLGRNPASAIHSWFHISIRREKSSQFGRTKDFRVDNNHDYTWPGTKATNLCKRAVIVEGEFKAAALQLSLGSDWAVASVPGITMVKNLDVWGDITSWLEAVGVR